MYRLQERALLISLTHTSARETGLTTSPRRTNTNIRHEGETSATFLHAVQRRATRAIFLIDVARVNTNPSPYRLLCTCYFIPIQRYVFEFSFQLCPSAEERHRRENGKVPSSKPPEFSTAGSTLRQRSRCLNFGYRPTTTTNIF